MHRKCPVTAQDSSSGSICTFAVQSMVEGEAQAFGPEGLLQLGQLFLPGHRWLYSSLGMIEFICPNISCLKCASARPCSLKSYIVYGEKGIPLVIN